MKSPHEIKGYYTDDKTSKLEHLHFQWKVRLKGIHRRCPNFEIGSLA